MSPVVIGSFAALDAAVVAQIILALRDFQKKHENESRGPAGSSRSDGDEE
jgi:hypothetical protein